MPDRHASTATPPPEASAAADGEPQRTPRRVAVLLPLPLTGPYDYLVPPELAVMPGSIVRVPLGQRELVGVVWEQPVETPAAGDQAVPLEKLRAILEVCDVPPLTEVARRFLAWVADYTLAPPGAVLRMALSSRSALEPPRPVTLYRVRDGRAQDGLRLTPARRRVLAELSEGPARSLADLTRSAGVGGSVVKGLVAAGALEAVELVQEPCFETPASRRQGPALSVQQAAAAAELRATVKEKAFSVSLLDGVTGSAKTEVYF